MQTRPEAKEFFHELTNTFSYVVYDSKTRAAAVIDSVLDYDHKSGRTSTLSADRIVEFIESSGLSVEWIFETHAHADSRGSDIDARGVGLER